MNKIKILTICAVPLCMAANPAFGVVSPTFGYETMGACRTGCTLGYCCPETADAYECPDGWSADLNGLCSRVGDTNTDSKGHYTQAYGTCAGTPSTKEVWTCFSTKQSDDCIRSLQQVQPFEPIG